jgi:phosphopantetheine--protein transferase-like protein
VERLLQDKTTEELSGLFTSQELDDAGSGPGRVSSLAARFAAKEASCKLFPRETALGVITPADFAVERDAYGAPCVKPSVNAQTVLDRHRVAAIRVSLTHTDTSASAIARATRDKRVPVWPVVLSPPLPAPAGTWRVFMTCCPRRRSNAQPTRTTSLHDRVH